RCRRRRPWSRPPHRRRRRRRRWAGCRTPRRSARWWPACPREVLRLGRGGDVVEQVLVLAECLVEPAADALGVLGVQAGVAHGVHDIALLGVVVGASREAEPRDEGDGGKAMATGHGTEHLGERMTGEGYPGSPSAITPGPRRAPAGTAPAGAGSGRPDRGGRPGAPQ